MKTLLLLGGSAQQVIAIDTARRMGLRTILCDYLPDNPGQFHADRFYLTSTTDMGGVLEVARKEAIDGVMAYASDPAAPTAAYVAEKLGLPTNPYASVDILCNKDKFRNFLSTHGFCTPKALSYIDLEAAIKDLEEGIFKFPVIVKPVDSSGSKGISQIDRSDCNLDSKLANAMSFSRKKQIIIEEFVEKFGYQIAGDGLSIDGKLVYRYFANDHFNSKGVNPFVPIAASFPYNMPAAVHDKVHAEIQRLLSLLGMKTCTYNFDIRIDRDYNVYLMEIAPRDGGNYIPQVMQYATGVNLVELSVKAAMGEHIDAKSLGHSPKGFYSYYAVHSMKNGVLKNIVISEEGQRHILENHIIVKPGDNVRAFTGANTALGCFVMSFDNLEQMLHMMDHSEEWIRIELE